MVSRAFARDGQNFVPHQDWRAGGPRYFPLAAIASKVRFAFEPVPLSRAFARD